jgi:hypothetical protein
VLLELGARHRGADAPAALLLGDGPSLGDFLDVDDQLGFDDVGAHLDQQVRPSGQHPRLARRARKQGDRPFQCVRCLVSHQW